MTADELRALLMKEYPGLRADALGDDTARIENTKLFKRKGLAFAVAFQGAERYPLSQFEKETHQPRPVISELIRVLISKSTIRGELYIWLTCPTGLLGDSKPIEMLEEEPERVIRAAIRERAEPEF